MEKNTIKPNKNLEGQFLGNVLKFEYLSKRKIKLTSHWPSGVTIQLLMLV